MRNLARVLCFAGAALATSLGAIPPETARAQTRHVLRGIASWYGRAHHGRRTASGVPFDMNAMTAAHKTLPFGTRVRVIHERTGHFVEVLINDRGPYVGARMLDLSKAAATALGMVRAGLAQVRLEILLPPVRPGGEPEVEPRRDAASLARLKLGGGAASLRPYSETGLEPEGASGALR